MNNTPINDGEPAFPVPMFTREADGQPMSAGEFFDGGNGMTLRDHFAGKALQGWLSHPTPQRTIGYKDTAIQCYRLADAMLAARKNHM